LCQPAGLPRHDRKRRVASRRHRHDVVRKNQGSKYWRRSITTQPIDGTAEDGTHPFAPTNKIGRIGPIPSGVGPFVFLGMLPDVATDGRWWVSIRTDRVIEVAGEED
jgi:hypothetical protein